MPTSPVCRLIPASFLTQGAYQSRLKGLPRGNIRARPGEGFGAEDSRREAGMSLRVRDVTRSVLGFGRRVTRGRVKACARAGLRTLRPAARTAYWVLGAARAALAHSSVRAQ